MTEPAQVQDPPAPAAPAPASTPSGPSADEVRALIREELAGFFGGLGKAPVGAPPPDLSTDKKVEEYVETLVAEKMKLLGPPADPPTDPTTVPPVTPEVIPTTKKSWQDKVRELMWGE